MGESKDYVSRSDELGNIHISEEVLAAISAAAALEVEGVSSLTNPSKKNACKNGKKSPRPVGGVIFYCSLGGKTMPPTLTLTAATSSPLIDSMALFTASFQQAVSSVTAHAGHDDAGHLALNLFGHGEEQRVDRGAVAADLFAGQAAHSVPGAGPDNPHLEVRRGQKGQSPVELIAGFGLPHLHVAQAVEPLSIHLGEADGHVLDNQHARDVGRSGQRIQRGLRHAYGGLQHWGCPSSGLL